MALAVVFHVGFAECGPQWDKPTLLTATENLIARIALINPRIDTPYWRMDYALPILAKKALIFPNALPLLAALTPPEHDITLIDENVEPIDIDALKGFDIVGVTGILDQRFRMAEICRQLKGSGVFIVAGGPWISISENFLDGLVDVIFVGEAEQTWPQFLEEWQSGTFEVRYEQATPTDVTQIPIPRNDLLKLNAYAFGGLQISRGCPYLCEYCEIIVLFGRKPRYKHSEQVIAELETLVSANIRMALIVDDNLIGNKAVAKQVLSDIAAWQRQKGYPIRFQAELSLDLAEDQELMALLMEANVAVVMIGIETPNEAALRAAKKTHNLRTDRSMLDKIQTIHDAGLDMWGLMMVGFDEDTASIFDQQKAFLSDAGIANVTVAMLSAQPKTPLYKRLKDAKRLDEHDPPEFGTNVIPANMSRKELQDGWLDLCEALYDPSAYFDRLDTLFLNPNFKIPSAQIAKARTGYWPRLKSALMSRLLFVFMLLRLLYYVPDAKLRSTYLQRIKAIRKKRKEPGIWFVYTVKCAFHYHFHTIAKLMREDPLRFRRVG